MKVALFTLQLLLAAQVVSGFFLGIVIPKPPQPQPPAPPMECKMVGFFFGRKKVCTPIQTNTDPSSDYCVCTASGDPHYKTFDGETIHFMGICKYTLAQLLEKNNKCYFNVEVKNEHRGWNKNVAYTRLVDVKIKGFTIRLHQGRRVFINNIEKFLPVTVTDGVTVARTGNNVMVTTACGIQVTFGNSVVVVRVPKEIGANKMNGICGSCNGNGADDFTTSTGNNVNNDRNKYNLVGNSYNVPDDSDQPWTHCLKIPPFPVCSEEKMSLFQGSEKYCGLLQIASSPFKQCIDSGRVVFSGYIKSCMLDVCANYESESEIETICRAHGAVASDCADNGILVDWRKPNFCPMVCGANEEYKFDASACEATCVNPTVGACNLPKQEGCACKAGFIRSGNECVQKAGCGCVDTNGDYYPMGSEKRTANCGEMFKCVFEGGRSFLKKMQSGITCHADATCGLVNGEHMCVCKTGLTGDGVNTCMDLAARCQCRGSGDPHYLLYDGQKIDFMGICMYTLSELTNRKKPCWFSVEVKNEQRGWNRVVSWTRMVDFSIYGQKVRILSDRRVQINGRTQYLPFTTTDGRMRVFYNGRNVQVDTNCFITVTFNGYSFVQVQVPTHLGGMLTGLCGNCNGKQDDYRTREGEDVTNDRNRFNLIGLSYTVTDDSDAITRGCTPPVDPPTECNAATQQMIDADTMCGMIKDTAGPFRECIDAAVVDVEQFYENCKVDTCAYNGKPGFTMNELVCDSLTAFAAVCNGYGFELFWRTPETCPLPCGPNEVYSPAVNPCPKTCNGQITHAICSAPKVEGCQCKPGFVLSDSLCVRETECGCKDADGSYYPIGASYGATDCSAVFKCEMKNNKPTLVRYPMGEGCHEDATCAWKNGERSCVCKEGYAGDGVYSCIDTQPCRCSVNGDPHYVTYDGQLIHFQGTCKYTLTQSTTTNDKCAFNVEVKNENRYRNFDVSWTRMVDFEIYGMRVRLLPGNKVEIDGEEKFLPFTYANGKLRVSLVAGKVQVDTDCGISVMFDGKQEVTVDVPTTYSNQMTGICGECDGNKNDYKTKEGDDLNEYEENERGQDIGNSYIVDDDSDSPSEECEIEKPPTGCSDESYKNYADVDYCGYIIDVAGPFRECIDSGLVAFQEIFESCRVDLCSYEATGKLNPRQITCESMSSFATACNAAGFVVMWREEDFCPMQCPVGQMYSHKVMACPPTCGEPAPDKFCKKPPSEGCQCPDGNVLNDKKCTLKKDCGCTDDEGNYLPIGETRISDDCTKTFTCTWDKKNVKSFVDVQKNGEPCGDNAKCTGDKKDKKCVCDEGFLGNGIKCNAVTTTTLPPPTTTTQVPPCELIADIGIIMDSSSSIGPKNYEIMKDFVKDVVTNFDVKPDKVRVALATYNSKAKVQFNFDTHGDEADIPFAIEKIHEINKGTYTDLALKKARKEIFSTARPNVPKIAIVLTDGLSRKPGRTRDEAKLLRDSGVTVFCIGIGNVSAKEINRISSDPDEKHSFMVDSFQALDSIKEAIKVATCEASKKGEN